MLGMSALPETRLITKVATLYHEQKLTQTDIAKRLGISQVTVSRLLKRAEENQIVRTTVISPPGAFVELEDILEKKFGLTQAIVGESQSDNRRIDTGCGWRCGRLLSDDDSELG